MRWELDQWSGARCNDLDAAWLRRLEEAALRSARFAMNQALAESDAGNAYAMREWLTWQDWATRRALDARAYLDVMEAPPQRELFG